MKFLIEQDWIRKDYWISDATGSTLGSYGVLIVSRLPVTSLQLGEMVTQMGRKFLLCQFNINGEQVIFLKFRMVDLDVDE